MMAGPKCIWLAWMQHAGPSAARKAIAQTRNRPSTPNLFWAHLPCKTVWLLMITWCMCGCLGSHEFLGHAIMWCCKGHGQHFHGITVATPESIQKGSALCKLWVGTNSGTSVIWKRLCPCNGFHLETIEWNELPWMSDTTSTWNQTSTICVAVQTASPRLMLS